MNYVSLVLESPSVGPTCDQPDNLQVNIRVVKNYDKHCVFNEEPSSLKETECTSGMVNYSSDSASFVKTALREVFCNSLVKFG